ncbi:hypothetical protein SISNIDRAFT_484879 [Sistotremastrum niveocremeum HHB9708]|uniref:PH domain-containing protein n=1 Tax=Sistotremastrum niveocremeum HHB9708 TaxID=1314777 RepID=A0A164V890_9AGAM|nr:hypothetical protein SISNIDRAFT_484879 [Sistotremastrum niveocremeum HHB9708]
MATFSDGDVTSFPSTDDIRLRLQVLLDSKEKQLAMASTLGQRLLSQQMDLEERISQLARLESSRNGQDMDDVPTEMRLKLKELVDSVQSWDKENTDLFNSVDDSIPYFQNGTANNWPASQASNTASHETSHVQLSSGPSAAQSSRRAKNAAHRETDAQFAFEIGSGLLTEVRRLQSLLGERDKALQDMKEEKDDLEKSLDSLRNTLRSQEQNADKFKEENWNLEVTLQELRTQHTEAQSSVQRLETEQKRITRQLAQTRETADKFKSDYEQLGITLAEHQAKHETDIAQLRKNAASLQRDKSDLQSSIEALKAEAEKKSRVLRRFESPSTVADEPRTPLNGVDMDEEGDVFGPGGASTNRAAKVDTSILFSPDSLGSDFADSSPEPSPLRRHLAPNHPSNELEVLKQSLGHAQRQISTLKSSLQREKELRVEYKRKLMDAAALTGNDLLASDFDDDDSIAEFESISAAKPGRSRRGVNKTHTRVPRSHQNSVSQKSGLRNSLLSYEVSEDETADEAELEHDDHPLYDGLSMTDQLDNARPDSSMTDIFVDSRRASLESMDPVFAELHRRPSSPVEVPRRSRAGAAYHLEMDSRPTSMMGPPSALAAELGIDQPEEMGHNVSVPVVSKVDFACQVDPMSFEPETPKPSVIDLTPIIVTQDIAIQADPPPPPALIHADIQTDDIVIPPRADKLIETVPEPRPILQSTETMTDDPPVVAIAVQTDLPVSTVPIQELDSTMINSPSSLIRAHSSEQIAYQSSGTDVDRSMGENTITAAVQRVFLSPDPHEETETEGEWQDARESIAATTPNASTLDFHSLSAATDREAGYSSGDQESIKVSQLPVPQTTYESISIQVDSSSPPPSKSDAVIQTDEINIRHSAPSDLYLVGPHSQHFQFISSGSSPGPDDSIRSMNSIRDSSASTIRLGKGEAQFAHDRRSIDSSFSPATVTEESRSRHSSTTLPQKPVDKSRPPMMMLPPPPRLPPPPESNRSSLPSRAMPPPSELPRRRDVPPPRPSSPPPPELIQRATTPTFGQVLAVPTLRGAAGRAHGASMPPTQQGVREVPSTSSFRSVANAASRAGQIHPSVLSPRQDIEPKSSGSHMSDAPSSAASRRSSLSSDPYPSQNQTSRKSLSSAPQHPGDISGASAGGSTDPKIIHAITQTMIGEFLYKYTRRAIGKGHGERRHRRYFWVHPYTKTLYWSSADPSASNVAESNAKSAYIQSVRSVLDPNPTPPGLYQYSVVVSTPQRDMKFTAPTKERHDIWFNALQYLLARPAAAPTSPAPAGVHDETLRPRGPFSEHPLPRDHRTSPHSVRTAASGFTGDTWSITPKAQKSHSHLSAPGSVGKRSGTPAAEYMRWVGPDAPQSPSRSFGEGFEHIPDQFGEDVDFEIHEEIMNDEGFDGLENVRTCCNGAHIIGHHPDDRTQHVPDEPQPANGKNYPRYAAREREREISEPTRPVSPSGWSFRSRAGSSHSHETGNFFGWSKGEDGRRRFGTRRSARGNV